ncbi:hypothetical protein [Aequorivita antarctica]|uniref:Patatin-like phospholipase family protein n=1 Tax=Aequorivita antarctica TaxID=153266 RepID=A0A5C6YYN8_9FLAO|nr:hypothetical protein [Aequorivita antarctica]TXD72563.1 hypothetical protein ESU54_12170 [Aequorivita antarctica]SRX75340.1 hypothetical protein AEQU3_02334 [Aequorivita antarctica]
MKNWLQKGINYWIIGWVVLSLLLIIINAAFRINSYIEMPQHGHFDNFETVNALIFSPENSDKIIFYHAFFILDFIWAALLLLIISYLIRDLFEDTFFRWKKYKILITVWQAFFFFSLLALLADVFEGFGYEFKWARDFINLKYISPVKVTLYAICFMFLLYWFLKTIFLPQIKTLIRFIQTALLSILFIIIIYVMVTFMEQGGTLIVDLFYRPLNIVILFFLLSFLALVLSHFPVYNDIWLYGNRDCVSLEMPKNKRSWLGLNIIYFDTSKAKPGTSITFDNEAVKNLRRSLGVLIYIAMFQIFLMMIPRYFGVYFNASYISAFLLLITLIAYNFWGKRYNQWKKDLKEGDEATKKETVEYIIKYVGRFPRYYLACVIMVFITAILVAIFKWDRIPFIAFLITLGCQMYLYIYFKICRTYFKYAFYTKELYDEKTEMFKKETLELFDKYGDIKNQKIPKYLEYFGKLSDNVFYLNFMRYSGIFSLVCLLLANSFFVVASWFSPLVIICLYIIVIYSILIILFKHLLYYHRLEEPKEEKDAEELKQEKKKNGPKNFYKYWLPLLIIFFFSGAIYMTSFENDLHELTEVKTHKPLDFDGFMISETANSYKKDNYFFVGSYGGGLKANLWNLLLFNQLDSLSKGEFFDRSIVLSGVSGGAVGIGNYASLRNYNDQKKSLNHEIFKIGTSNVLSNELTYLLGRDLIREYLPFFNYHGKDRSYKSMKLHAINTGMPLDDFHNISYLDVWRNLYEKRGRKFPALIMNSTSVAGRQGVVSTVRFPDSTFAGADNLSIFENGRDSVALTYYGAVSTTNRFPLFSPTAKIRQKGNYLDGGYFENSGMLSAMEVYDAIEREAEFNQKVQPIFINIINSGDFYIRQKLFQWKFSSKTVKESGEFASIIGTVVSIDKLPGYIYEKIKNRGFAIVPVMMPHKMTYEKVREILKAEVDNPLALMDSIQKNNEAIDNALRAYKPYKFDKWGVVEPPLARLLSEPAVQYQEAMVHKHPEVQETLMRILDFIKTDTVVTNKNQYKLHRPISKYKNENNNTIDSLKLD